MSYTKGPWHVVNHRPNLVKVETNRVVICDSFGGLSDEATANAHLIAAAPDLLAACETVVNDCDLILDGDDLSGMSDQELFASIKQTLLTAVAKAKGGAK